jgi:hypothetical protein
MAVSLFGVGKSVHPLKIWFQLRNLNVKLGWVVIEFDDFVIYG